MTNNERIEELFRKYEEEIMIIATKLRSTVNKRNVLLNKIRSSLLQENSNRLDKVIELDKNVDYNEIKNGL